MIKSIGEYHSKTSYNRYGMSGHIMDWPNQPNVFKNYSNLPQKKLAHDMGFPKTTVYSLSTGVRPIKPGPLEFKELSKIIILTHSITAKSHYSGGIFHYRSVASAGALYPSELYIAVRGIKGLSDGLYHHDVFNQALTLLRGGTPDIFLEYLSENPDSEVPNVVIFITAIFFRSSWKYRDRAYRYNLLDSGHMVENLSLALKAYSVVHRISYDFQDDAMNQFLGVDANREVCLAVTWCWTQSQLGSHAPNFSEDAARLAYASRVSANEIDYQIIRQVHHMTSHLVLDSESDTRMVEQLGISAGEWVAIPECSDCTDAVGYPESVFNRRSMRNFVTHQMDLNNLWILLRMLCEDQTGRFESTSVCGGLAIGFVTGNIEGFPAGFYLLDRSNRKLCKIKDGNFVTGMAEICLDQKWLENCAVHFLFMSNLKLLEQVCGMRSYRHVMLNSGRLGQRLYLGATASRLGCCGIGAFYDSEAASTLGLGDDTKLLYLVGVGPVKKYSAR